MSCNPLGSAKCSAAEENAGMETGRLASELTTLEPAMRAWFNIVVPCDGAGKKVISERSLIGQLFREIFSLDLFSFVGDFRMANQESRQRHPARFPAKKSLHQEY